MADDSKQTFLNALFQWTVKNSNGETAGSDQESTNTASSSLAAAKPMNDDDRKWLGSALDNMTVNPVERLKICIKQLKENGDDIQRSKEFLNELCGWTEELDLAKDFFNVGGLDILPQLLNHQDDEIRCKTCLLMATLVQNNDHCQRIIVQSGLQEKLLKIVDESKNPDLQTNAITAISALIRGYVLGQLQLQKYQGPKILLGVMHLPIPRLQMKICFLINTICSATPHMKKIFFENGALNQFVILFNNETCPDSQHVLETIVTLSSAKPNALSQLDATMIQDFTQKLDKRLETLRNDEHAGEEISLINQLKSSLKV